MMNPKLGEPNPGAIVGAVTGSIGGLMALGIAPAILSRAAVWLVAWPLLSIVSWLISAIVGWFLGGQIGPRLEPLFGERNGHILGGIVGGLVPATTIALWSWHIVTAH